MQKLKIVAFTGSLRKKSYNAGVLRFAKEILADQAEVEIYDLAELPLFNADLEQQLPEAVSKFKDALKSADAIFISSPEFNYSFSGVLKNAIDWASRPRGQNSLDGKPGAVTGVSNGKIGTARGYYDLRKVLGAVNMFLPNYPEVLITMGPEKFDADGNLLDQETKTRVKALLDTLIDLTQKLKTAGLAK